ncbi:UrcA family protein [Novosphingobium sp. KACC 22771]|uniref:UrcA family protein n=1 Tax=Novosphingobium sp. KACC 22771 TaxID=3025670 RepID=UPI002366ED99|nr:UrcA family protein [Novosphingobium sp. KACC 22771]WDF74615.1 UrcA family protein [Novosphingobium sp. KACC 22771]
MKTVFAVLAAVSLAAGASAAQAGENPLAKDSAVLRLDGLDLATVDGQQRLAIRLDQAVAAVCGDRLAGVHLALEEQSRACRAAVVADVRAQIERRQAAAASPVKLALAR